MKVNIKGINDLYLERYIQTKKMIDEFHQRISKNLDEQTEPSDYVAIEILNNLVSDK